MALWGGLTNEVTCSVLSFRPTVYLFRKCIMCDVLTNDELETALYQVAAPEFSTSRLQTIANTQSNAGMSYERLRRDV